jgi:hypothetical protein
MSNDGITINVIDLSATATLKATPAAVNRAVLRAGGDSVRALRAEAVRTVRDRKAIKAGKLRGSMKLIFPTNKQAQVLKWVMGTAVETTPVGDYPHRQVKRGVSVQINKGRRVVMRGYFAAEMASGHKGVFKRKGPKRVMTRGKFAGKRRQPIKEAFTSRIVDVFADEGFNAAVLERANTVFRSTFDRNMKDFVRRATRRSGPVASGTYITDETGRVVAVLDG